LRLLGLDKLSIMKTYIVLDNVRSCSNVGSILRTADCLGIDKVVMTGYTPYPVLKNDSRLPHIADKITKRIAKTALGAEISQDWSYYKDIISYLRHLKQDLDFNIVAIEQADNSSLISNLKSDNDIALVFGNEVTGLRSNVLNMCDQIYEINLKGKKESLNVSIAAAIACYQLKYVL